MGIDTVQAQEPGGTHVGRLIRQVLLDAANSNIDAKTELLLYFASRAQNVAEVIKPAIECGKLVVCDRFTDSTVAYQGHGRHLGADTVLQLDKIACAGVKPDLTIWLDLDPAAAWARVDSRISGAGARRDRMEQQTLAFFSRVRAGYGSIHRAEPGRVRRIDAEGPPAAVAGRVLKAVLPRIGELPKGKG